MRQQLAAYFGVDGSMDAADWRFAVLDVAPPLLVALIVGDLDGVRGLGGFLITVVYLVVLRLAWSAALRRMGLLPPLPEDDR